MGLTVNMQKIKYMEATKNPPDTKTLKHQTPRI
jgi:hypothetical protein